MAGGEGFHLTISDVPALGLRLESASCFKQAFVAAAGAAPPDARVTEIKTSRSGDRRFGPRHAALLQKLQAAKKKVPSERKRLSTKWQSLDEYSGKWLRGEQSGDGTCKLQAQRALRAARHCRP